MAQQTKQDVDVAKYVQHINQKQYENDETVQSIYNEKTQQANIKQVYKVHVTQLTNSLFLGTQWQAHDTNTMKSLAITHLISCIKDDWSFVNNLKNLEQTRIEISEMVSDENKYDDDNLPLEQIWNNYLKDALDIILKKNGNKILIYCNSSSNHSPTIAIVIMMYSQGNNLKDAYDFVKARQGRMMCISDGWMKQLRELDKKLHGKYSTKDNEIETQQSKRESILAKIKKAQQQLKQETALNQ